MKESNQYTNMNIIPEDKTALQHPLESSRDQSTPVPLPAPAGDTSSDTPAKRRRGRPSGSKNKKKGFATNGGGEELRVDAPVGPTAALTDPKGSAQQGDQDIAPTASPTPEKANGSDPRKGRRGVATSGPQETDSDAKMLDKYWDRSEVNWSRIKRVQESTGEYLRYYDSFGWAQWDHNATVWQPVDSDHVLTILGQQNKAGAVKGQEILARGAFFKEADWINLAKWVRRIDPTPVKRPPTGMVMFTNGVADLNTMTLQPKPGPFGEHTYYSRVRTAFNHNPMPIEVFKFFCSVASWDPLRLNLIRWEIKRLILRDTTAQMAFIYAGKAGTGKSTLLEFYRFLVGGASAELKSSDFGEKFHISRIKGKDLVVVDELAIRRLSDKALQTVKIAVSGGILTGEEKFGAIDEFRPQCTLVAATNELRLIDLVQGAQDQGLSRRFVTLPVEFNLDLGARDKNMLETLCQNTPSILGWAMGLDPRFNPEDLALALSTHMVQKIHGTSTDPILDFVTTKCMYDPGAQTWLGHGDTSFETIEGSYFNFLKKTEGGRCKVPNDFTDQMRKALVFCGKEYRMTRKKRGYMVLDISLLKNASKNAKPLALVESDPVRDLRTVPVFTTKRRGGAVAPFAYGNYSCNTHIEETRHEIMEKQGLTITDIDSSEKRVLEDTKLRESGFSLQSSADSSSDDIAQLVSHGFDTGEVFFNTTLDDALFDRLSPGISSPRERLSLLQRSKRAWGPAAESARDFATFFECDLYDAAAHLRNVKIPSLRHNDWTRPYPEGEAMNAALCRMKTLPLSGGRVHTVLNFLGERTIPQLYSSMHETAVLCKEKGENFEEWFLLRRPHMNQCFALAYTESYGSVYPRLQPVPNHPKSTVLSQGHGEFKLQAYKAVMEKVNGDYEIHVVDLRSCHSFFYSGLFGEEVEAWNRALASNALWQHLAAFIPSSLVPEPLGADFALVKKQLKVWVYKTLQGGSPYSDQESHEHLKDLFPQLRGKALIDRGDAIVNAIPALLDLTKLSDEVKKYNEIYFPTSPTPFRYAFKKDCTEKNRVEPFSIWEWQELDPEELPHFVGKATAPQKVSRILTGLEIVLLMVMVQTITVEKLGLVLALESDGLSVMTKKGEGQKLIESVNASLRAFAPSFIGVPVEADITLCATSNRGALKL